jgi:hypothetical protein
VIFRAFCRAALAGGTPGGAAMITVIAVITESWHQSEGLR